jgi:hypothetical protein
MTATKKEPLTLLLLVVLGTDGRIVLAIQIFCKRAS